MWMNQPSKHQEELAVEMRQQGVNLLVVYVSPLRKERAAIGWAVHTDAQETRVLSNRYAFREAMTLVRDHRQSVHIVNGIWAEPVCFVVLVYCFFSRIPACVYSEAPTSTVRESWSGPLKRALQKLLTQFFAKRMSLLAISWLAERAFLGLGFPPSKIYRFGYFENPPPVSSEVQISSPEILYVGRLVKGKGIELLIEASKPLLRENPSLRLRIVGGGVMEPELRRLAQASEVAGQIVFSGVIPSHSVPECLRGAEMLVLPSEEDGWGIVINQALQAGTPVVLSDSCGAAELVVNGVNGYIFRTGDANHLSGCIRAVLNRSDPQKMRVAAKRSGDAVSAEEVAPYLRECLEHMLGMRAEKPVPKWILNPKPSPADI